MLVADVPRVLREEVYALAALVGATMVWAAEALAFDPLRSAAASVAAVFAIRRPQRRLRLARAPRPQDRTRSPSDSVIDRLAGHRESFHAWG